MFRCQPVAWSLFLWAQIFAYSLLTTLDARPAYRATPVLLGCASIVLLIVLIAKKAAAQKTYILFAAWGFMVGIAVLLTIIRNPNHPQEPILQDWHLNILVTVFTALAALIWLAIGHVSHITEPAFYCYVWSIITIIAMCSAFNNASQTAIIIYLINAALLTAAHLMYVKQVCDQQTPGQHRCRHIFRVFSCLTLSCGILIGSILYKMEELTQTNWEYYILAIEGILLLVLITDGFIGFLHQGIKYAAAPTNDNSNV